jgi:5-methylcytosine-specific restriction endonuclease McrA
METQLVYRSQTWKVVRRAVLARDAYQCRIGLPGCQGRATQADHIVSLEVGGAPFDMGNLQAACKHCNVTKENLRRQGLGVGSVRRW